MRWLVGTNANKAWSTDIRKGFPCKHDKRGREKKWQISGVGKPPAGIYCGARNMFTPAVQPIKTGSVPAGRLLELNAGRYSISTGNVGIARSSSSTVIVIIKGMSFLITK